MVVVDGTDARAHALAWVADRSGWLIREEHDSDRAVLATVVTVAADPPPPGRWRGGATAAADPALDTAAAPSGELARAYSARAALADSQRHEVDRLRAQLVEQRAWVASEAERARASQAWRLGHRLARMSRLLSLRRDRGTDALQQIVDRMNEPVE